MTPERAVPSLRQCAVLRAIIQHFEEHRECPSFREIAREAMVPLCDVSRIVENLAIKGWLLAPGHTRSLIVLADPDNLPRPVLRLVRSEESRLSMLAAELRKGMREAEDEGARQRLSEAHGDVMKRLKRERNGG